MHPKKIHTPISDKPRSFFGRLLKPFWMGLGSPYGRIQKLPLIWSRKLFWLDAETSPGWILKPILDETRSLFWTCPRASSLMTQSLILMSQESSSRRVAEALSGRPWRMNGSTDLFRVMIQKAYQDGSRDFFKTGPRIVFWTALEVSSEWTQKLVLDKLRSLFGWLPKRFQGGRRSLFWTVSEALLDVV